MHRQWAVSLVSCGIAAVALTCGTLLILTYGFQPPGWLLRCEVAIGSGVALIFGFTAAATALRPWLRLRPVRGTLLVCLGVAALFVPPNFLASAVFLAVGIRLVWRTACEQADAEREAAAPEPGGGTAIVRVGGSERRPAAAPAWRIAPYPMDHAAERLRSDRDGRFRADAL